MDEESEPGNIADDSRTDPVKKDVPHPWPYLREFFDVVGAKKDSWRMRCVLCQPKNHELLAYKNSPSNLNKQVSVFSVVIIAYHS